MRGWRFGQEIAQQWVGRTTKYLERDATEFAGQLTEDYLRAPCIGINGIPANEWKYDSYHCRDKVESTHPYTDVLIIDTGQNSILVLGNEVGMCRHNLHHSQEGNVLDYMNL